MKTPPDEPTLPRCPAPEGWLELPLGTVSDEDLARALRDRGTPVGRSTVTRARHVLGIPTFVPQRRPRPEPRQRIPWHELPLGVIYDALLAKHLGLTHPAVLHQRRSRGIPTAPRSPENLLLGLVQRRPGLRLRSYSAQLDIDARAPARTLVQLGLVTRDGDTLNPVLKPKKTRSRDLQKPPNPLLQTPTRSKPSLETRNPGFEGPSATLCI